MIPKKLPAHADHHDVNPARAGMIPEEVRVHDADFSKPRASGDDPLSVG